VILRMTVATLIECLGRGDKSSQPRHDLPPSLVEDSRPQ
jgi:hypothetical protein